MKRLIISTAISLIFILRVKAQDFTIGKYDTLRSAILNENRAILVHVPAGYHGSSVRFPVMYLLDGDSHFTKTVGILDHLSNTTGNELCPQMIVVAIIHPDRDRDLIPPVSTTATPAGDKFPEFLEKELIPYIDSRYPTSPYRVFAGHSLGGLRVINTMVFQPHLFNSYIALDPSLGHTKGWINNAIDAFNKNDYSGKALYIAMGLTMPKGMDTSAISRDTTGASRHMRCIMSFAKKAGSGKNSGLDFNWKYYPDETHQSVSFKGTYDGLVANFHWFKNERLYDIFKPELNAVASVKIMTDYYEGLSKKMGYTIVAPEQAISELIDYLTFKKWQEKALAFSELNFKNYPSSRRAKDQFETISWETKKSVETLYPNKSAKQIYLLCKQEAGKKSPSYNISENAINAFAYTLMQKEKYSEAEIIFKLNVDLYPSSYNVYDSYGECLLRLGKENEGIAAYKRSLELNPQNTNAADVIANYKQRANK